MTETVPKPMFDPAFWRDRRVFVTGHTGFKGAWLTVMLHRLGARVRGYALAPDTEPSLFDVAGVADVSEHRIGNVKDAAALLAAIEDFRPEIVFHLAAQSLVRRSYRDPVETFETNVLGTVHLLDACRRQADVRAVVNVTTDKCYEDRGRTGGYRESDRLGGSDPYSASKACSELVTEAYRRSFFEAGGGAEGPAVATARAGNVIGGGDWCADRIVPDAVRAFSAGAELAVRNLDAVRPWQHVIDPLFGYLVLAQRCAEAGPPFAKAWNFGPGPSKLFSVGALVEALAGAWPGPAQWASRPAAGDPAEAATLVLHSGLAEAELGWRARIGFDDAVALTVEWYAAWNAGAERAALRALMERQIDEYPEDAPKEAAP